MPRNQSSAPEPTPPAERGSVVAFSTILLLVLLAISFPEMPPQALQGFMWAGVGLMMLWLPPWIKLPRAWPLLAAGFAVAAAVGFLPREWFGIPQWRSELESLGLDTGRSAFVQPWLALESLANFAITAAAVLYMLGHRVSNRMHHRLALGFALGVGAWASFALYIYQPGGLFGFFPNRNHTATLLAMGTFVGLGTFTQAIRYRNSWIAGLSALPVGVCLYSIYVASESRAGIVLVIAGFVIWISASGIRHLRGNAGKALLLILLAAVGIFLIVDTKVKARLSDSIEQMAPAAPGSATSPETPFVTGTTEQPALPKDGRITIFQDTLEMIRQSPWTGVGPAQFAQVFPQYRKTTTAPNGSRCLHPESDWLMMMAEIGLPATLCLAGGVLAVIFTALKCARNGRGRVLRAGCITAAMLLCLHGIFDVPGHRIGLAWGGALLLAMSLRPPEANGSRSRPSRWSTYGWRGLGLTLSLAGIFLLHAQWAEKPLLQSARISHLMGEAKALYAQDQVAYDKATAEGRDYQPDPADDPLEKALLLLADVNHLAPLDPHPYYVRGTLALHYDDKKDIAYKAFAIQRRLDPARVDLAMEQAQAWVKQDPQQVIVLWEDALRRAATEESRHPGSHSRVVNTYQKMLHAAGKDEPLFTAALKVAGHDADLWILWARTTPVPLLDREMPRLLEECAAAVPRRNLFQTWEKRGSKQLAADCAKSHPELDLSQP